MSFNPGGTDYRGAQFSMDRADEGLTRALDRKGRADKQKRIKSETSPMQGIANIARVGAAIYTGGASEASGLGAMGSKALQGRRSDGSAYDDQMGDVIGTVAGGYNLMEGLKQEDISNLKAEDIANYERDMTYAKQFPEGSNDRKGALVTARRNLKNSQSAQKYGDRADTNPFLYKKGRRDAPDLDPFAVEGTLSKKGGAGYNHRGDWLGSGPDPNVVPEAVLDGKEDQLRRLSASVERDRGPSGEALDKGGIELREEGRKEAARFERQKDFEKIRQKDRENRIGALAAEQGPDQFSKDQSLNERFDRQRQVDKLVDSELNKRISRGGLYSGSKDDVLTFGTEADRESNESETYRQGPYKDPTGGGREYFQQGGMGKTFSEKEAEKLSSKDRDGSSAMDDIAFTGKGKALEERGGFLRGYDRLLDPKQGKEDAQHLYEYNLQKEGERKRAKKLEERQRAGEFTPSIKSALRKRVEARKRAKEIAIKKGGILVQ